VCLSSQQLGQRLRREKLSCRRTEPGLGHKQDPEQVARAQGELGTMEKGERLVAWTSAISTRRASLTLPTTTTWGPVGKPRRVSHEAPQGRRLNVIGAYFSHGPEAGRFEFAAFAKVPLPERDPDGSYRQPLAEVAAKHGLTEEDLGTVDSETFLAFVWQVAGRPVDAPSAWRRERPLMVVVDNYSVHRSERVQWERRALEAADIWLVYLPAYSPELSRIETHWKVTKYHDLPKRSYARLGDLKAAVERALAQRAIELRLARSQSAH
jgi:transposase